VNAIISRNITQQIRLLCTNQITAGQILYQSYISSPNVSEEVGTSAQADQKYAKSHKNHKTCIYLTWQMYANGEI